MQTIKIMRRPRSQSGFGVGNIFRSLFRSFVPVARTVLKASKPFVKKAAKMAGKEALQVGVETLSDIAGGENVSTALKKNVKAGSKRTFSKAKEIVKKKGSQIISDSIKGGGKRGRVHSTLNPPQKKKKRKKVKSIFD